MLDPSDRTFGTCHSLSHSSASGVAPMLARRNRDWGVIRRRVDRTANNFAAFSQAANLAGSCAASRAITTAWQYACARSRFARALTMAPPALTPPETLSDNERKVFSIWSPPSTTCPLARLSLRAGQVRASVGPLADICRTGMGPEVSALLSYIQPQTCIKEGGACEGSSGAVNASAST